MTANVQIVISAQDRASTVVAGVEKSFVSMGTRLKTAGHNILTGIFAEQTVITRTAHLFDQKMHTAFAPVIASLFLAGDLIQPFGGAITGALGRVAKAGPVMAASAALGGAIGAVQAEAQALAATGTAAVSGMATRIAAMSIPLAAEGTTVGTAVGGAMGIAVPAAFAIAAGGIISAIAILPQQWALDQTYASVGKTLADKFAVGYADEVKATYTTKVQAAFDAARAGGKDLHDAAQAGKDAGDAYLNTLGKALSSPFDISGLTNNIKKAGIAVREVWDKSAQALDGDLASALQNNTSVIDTAMEKVKWALQHPLELAAQEAKIQGAIQTLEYSRGMASNNAEINAVIDQQLAVLKGQWATISGKAYDAGAAAANSYVNGYQHGFGGGPNIKIHTGSGWQNVVTGTRASGGPVNAGETYLVGERGPELLHMGAGSGYVQAGGGHGHTIVMDGRVVAQLIDERFGKKLAMASSSAYTRG